MKSFALSLVLSGFTSMCFALNLGSISSKPKVGRVSAGPIEISNLGCGTWSWGNRLLFDYNPSQDEGIFEAYREIRDAGVTIFDTADSYGTFDLNGRAEYLLGQFERRYQIEVAQRSTKKPWWDLESTSPTKSNQQQVATKLAPYPWRVTRGQVLSAAKGSLRRLQQPKLAIAQLHWSTSNYQPLQERALWEGIADVYDEGLCEAIGVRCVICLLCLSHDF
jgi:pyridoxine 4-dehydrogenase